MSYIRWTLLICALGCVPKVLPGPVPVDEAAKPVTLLELPDKNSPNIYLEAMIRTGSAMDPIGKEGLAAFTAQGMIHGGTRTVEPEAFKARLFPTGNSFNVVVSREYTSIKLRCHIDHAAQCVDSFVGALTAPRFDSAVMERVRDEALYAVTDGILSDEEQLGNAALDAALYEGHRYAHPVRGRAGTIGLLTPEDAKIFHETQFVRQSIQVGIGGGFQEEHRDQLTQGLLALSSALPADAARQAPVPVTGRQLLIISTETPVTGFHLGHHHSVTRNHPDYAALYVATLALGAHRQSSGRLFETLRTQRGLNYGDYAYIEAFQQFGSSTYPEQGILRSSPMFYLWLRPTSVVNGPFALKLAIDELEKWVADGLSQQEFQTIQKYALGHLPLEAQNIGRRLSYQLSATASGTPDPLQHLSTHIAALTREEINAAIQRHIRPDDLMIVAVSGEGNALLSRLNNLETTPIQYHNVTPSAAQAQRDSDIANKALDIEFETAEVRSAKGLFR